MGGVGVYLLKQRSLYGVEKNELTIAEYKKALAFLGAPGGREVGDVENSGIKGKKFLGTQQMSGKPVEWKHYFYPFGKFVYNAFGFCRPDN